MIPFASQRGNGQDLATHLMNAHDNETAEIAQVRGAVAQDLHGAFAEWEAQAAALTRCRNFLYSLSVNPDPSHGRLSRDQYLAYIDRVEEQLGLAGQPRAVVFHIKEGREHCHVVWSRVDVEQGKAVHLAYDHDKLMMATKAFAAEHGIKLPAGYDSHEPGHQLTLYEKVQHDRTGLSLEERKAVVTALWQRSDTPAAFVSALAEHGYILATGKRPFVLVDLYGQMNALPKLIDDRQTRTNDLRAFFGESFGPETLPSVEEAQALAAQHRLALEDFEKARQAANRWDDLDRQQAERRAELEERAATLQERQWAEFRALEMRQVEERRALRQSYLAEMREVRLERARRRPTGLAAFLGRVSGVALITKKVQRYRDRKRFEAYRRSRQELRDRQAAERATMTARHELQAATLARERRDLAQVEERERQSAKTARLKERRARLNARHVHMPRVGPGPEEAARTGTRSGSGQRRRARSLSDELNQAAQEGQNALAKAFHRAAVDDQTDGDSGDDEGSSVRGIHPHAEGEPLRRTRRRKPNQDDPLADAPTIRRRRTRRRPDPPEDYSPDRPPRPKGPRGGPGR